MFIAEVSTKLISFPKVLNDLRRAGGVFEKAFQYLYQESYESSNEITKTLVKYIALFEPYVTMELLRKIVQFKEDEFITALENAHNLSLIHQLEVGKGQIAFLLQELAKRFWERRLRIDKEIISFRDNIRNYMINNIKEIDFTILEGTLLSFGVDYYNERKIHEAFECWDKIAGLTSKSFRPWTYATTQNNLGNAYKYLPSATPEERASNIKKAILCYESALEIYKRDEYPHQYCYTSANLGMVLLQIGNREKGCWYIKEAYELREFLPDQGKQLEDILNQFCRL